MSAERLLELLRAGELALVTGPSGAGKSRLARAVLAACADRGIPAVLNDAEPAGDRVVVDCLPGSLARRLRLLAAVGLADAGVFVRRAGVLSVGERARLRVAMASAALTALARRTVKADVPTSHAPRAAPVLVLDEFGSTLDRPGAARLCHLLRRMLRHAGSAPPRRPIRIIAITAHDDLATPLAPEVTVRVRPGAMPLVQRAGPPCPDPLSPRAPAHRPPEVIIELGTYRDYAALAHHHYRAARPAVLAGPGAIRRAIDPATGDLLGVLVVAMPALNATWRTIPWPGRYSTGDKRADAARVLAEIRCIARVIVHPTHRGRGIAAALVHTYLASPLTPATEAVAAMGAACPFFAAAGMRAYRLPPSARDARLLDCLHFLGLTPMELLELPGDPRPHTGAARDRRRPRTRNLSPHEQALLQRELRRWGQVSHRTRGLVDTPLALAHRAAESLLAQPVAYAHVNPHAAPSATAQTHSKGALHATLAQAA